MTTQDYEVRILEKGIECEKPVLIYVTSKDRTAETDQIYQRLMAESEKPFLFCELAVADWDSYLTPWPDSECFQGRSFAGKGKELLEELESVVLTKLREKYPSHGKVYVVGYSLAGLFAIWALGKSGLLDGAASCSGSLWYPGYDKYMTNVSFDRDVEVYLSLGKKEPKNKHFLMRQIGDMTQKQYELFLDNEQVKRVDFVWHEGGHFADVENRILQGMRYLLQ